MILADLPDSAKKRYTQMAPFAIFQREMLMSDLDRKEGKLLAILCLSLGLFCASTNTASAFPWGYSPLTGSNNFLWLSRSLYSPTGLFRGGSAYSTPYYLLNNLTYTAASLAGRGINAVGKKEAAKQFYSNPRNGINAPVVDQIAPASWYQPQASAQPILNPEIAPLPADFKDNGFMPVPLAADAVPETVLPAEPAGQQATNGNQVPAPAPDFRAENVRFKNPFAKASSNPFAEAFIVHLNENFNGDIGQALQDKSTRQYAQALGVTIDKSKVSELSDEKKELIRRILLDPNEDSLSKVNALRLLVKH